MSHPDNAAIFEALNNILLDGAPPMPGTDIVANGSFDSATGWSLGDGWSIASGEAYAVDPAADAALSQSLTFGAQTRRAITLEAMAIYSGSVAVAVGGTEIISSVSAAGTYREWFVPADATGLLEIVASPDFQGDLSSISVNAGYPIAWPGVNFTPPATGPWLEVSFFPNGPLDPTLSADGTIPRGLYQVEACVRPGAGVGPAQALAAQVMAAFPKLSGISGLVRIYRAPYQSAPLIEDDRIAVAVTIPYSA